MGLYPGRLSRDTILLLAALAALLAVRLVCQLSTFGMDDAFITYRYAENFAQGRGLVFHPGERVLGTTTPLYALLCAAFYAGGFALDVAMPRLNILIDAAILALVWRSVLQGEAARVAFACLYMASPLAGRLGANGMETDLFALMLLASFCLARQRPVPASALCALSCFCRPEGLIGLAVLLAGALREGSRRAAAKQAGAAALVLGAGAAVLYAYYGHVLPLSMVLKSHGMGASRLAVAKIFLAFDPVSLLASAAALWGLRPALHSGNGALRSVSWFALAYFAAYLAAAPSIALWYAYPFLLALFLWASLAAGRLIRRVPALPAAAPLALLSGLAAGLVFWLALYPRIEDVAGVRQNLYGDLQHWCEETRPPTILACDVGRIGYYCKDSYIYDICGLVWTDVEEKYHGRGDLARAIGENRPDYLLLNPIAPYMSVMKEEPGYTLMRRFAPQGSEASLSGVFPETYVREYFLFQRNRDGSGPSP